MTTTTEAFDIGAHATDRTGEFAVRPYTPHCAVIRDAGDHAVIGISPGNSYFSARRVIGLARWAAAEFREVDLVYTDVHVAEMYEAFGYPADDARRKAVKNLRGVRAKVHNAVESVGRRGGRVRSLAVSELADNTAYRALHTRLGDLLEHDADFRVVCQSLVDRFLSDKVLNGRTATERQRAVCLEYIRAEAPLFLEPAILGAPSSLNCYHQLLPMAELLYARGSGLRASRNQGHAIVTPTADAAVRTEGHAHEH